MLNARESSSWGNLREAGMQTDSEGLVEQASNFSGITASSEASTSPDEVSGKMSFSNKINKAGVRAYHQKHLVSPVADDGRVGFSGAWYV